MEDFIHMLNLREPKLFGIDLEAVIRNTYSFVEKIWASGQMLDKFTDHGIGHSYETLKNALDIADKLLVHCPLNVLEKTILVIACLIHDIGMQCVKYSKWKKLSPNEVRKSHCSIGFDMFKIALCKRNSDVPKFTMNNPDIEKPLILEKALIVAFSHCSEDERAKELWKNLKNDEVRNTKRRLKLLAGLLRLGDELDMCFDRVPEINRIMSSTLPVESKAHWACCYYVKNAKPEAGANGKGSMRVVLSWHAPNDEDQIDKIRKLLTELRVQRFNQEIDLVKTYLKEEETVPEPIIEKIERLPEPEKTASVRKLPKEIVEYIVTKLYPYTFGKGLEIPENLIEIKDQSFTIAKTISDEFIRLGKGVIPAHYVLKTRFHTDKYIKCRDLVCNNNFVIELVKALKKKFVAEFRPTRVVSIGTSAIRIGSLLSIVLSVPFSYAVGEVEIALDKFPSSASFERYEKVILISPKDKLLIIDDILGVGTVFEKIMKQLTNLGVEMANVVFFYIYSLGHEKKFLEKFPKVRVYFLNAYPDIKYWQEKTNGGCEFCKNKPEIRNFE